MPGWNSFKIIFCLIQKHFFIKHINPTNIFNARFDQYYIVTLQEGNQIQNKARCSDAGNSFFGATTAASSGVFPRTSVNALESIQAILHETYGPSTSVKRKRDDDDDEAEMTNASQKKLRHV